MQVSYLSLYSSLNVSNKWSNEWEYPEEYCQKFSVSDIIRLQGIVTQEKPIVPMPTFTVINLVTNESTVFTPILYPGEDTDDIFDLEISGLAAGSYYLSIFDTSESEEIKNIPFRIFEEDATELENTVLIRYSNNRNDFDYNFLKEDGEAIFTDFRVEGGRLYESDIYDNQSEYFRNQSYYQRQLSSIPFTREGFNFGDTAGAPSWVGEKLNMIFSLSDIYIDDIRYERSEGAQLVTQQKDNHYPLYNYTIELEKTERRYSEIIEEYGVNPPVEGLFTITINTTTNNANVTLPLTAQYGEIFVIWGDGSAGLFPSETTVFGHTYATAGTYQIQIGYDFQWSYANSSNIAQYLISIDEWGSGGYFRGYVQAFRNCARLTTLATDVENALFLSGYYIFANTGITEIPFGLFDNSEDISTFEGAFMDCKAIKIIPPQLFSFQRSSCKSFAQTFSGCTSLETISNAVFNSNRTFTTAYRCFYNCSSLRAVPDILFNIAYSCLTFEDCFRGCTSLISVGELVFAGPNCTNFSNIFYGCTSLSSVHPFVFQNCGSAQNFGSAFYGCTSLINISEVLFAPTPNVTSFASTFQGCTSLTSIPENLFSSNTGVTSFSSTFSGCSSLAEIPAGLFTNNTAVSTFANTFFGCINLTSIPGSLFTNNVNVTSFGQTFRNCLSLTSIPGNLFSNNLKVTTFSYCFAYAGITSVSSGLFQNNISTTNISGCFSDTALTSIPGGLLSNLINLTDVSNIFSQTKLTSVPDGIFNNNPNITNLTNAFSQTAITSVSGGILDGVTNSTNINAQGMFYYCLSLVSVSGQLSVNDNIQNVGSMFAGCTSLTSFADSWFSLTKSIRVFDQCFADCTALGGESPTPSDGLKLWQRSGQSGYPSSVSGTQCFANCTQLNDYSEIPSTWK